MGKLESKIQDINTLGKRETIIEDVKLNLDIYSSLLLFVPSVWDMVKSHSGSLITIENDKDVNYMGNAVGGQVGRAIDQERKNSEFIDKYNKILSALSDTQRNIVLKRHIEHIPVYKLERGNSVHAGDKRAYSKLNDAYLIIAILDSDIEFTVTDYVEIKSAAKYNKGRYTQLKEEASLFLLDYFENKDTGFIDNRITECIDVIPERECNKLISYLNEKADDRKPTSYEYRQISRSLVTFAYLYDEIKLDKNEYEELIQDDNRGARKYLKFLYMNIANLSGDKILNINIQKIHKEIKGEVENETQSN